METRWAAVSGVAVAGGLVVLAAAFAWTWARSPSETGPVTLEISKRISTYGVRGDSPEDIIRSMRPFGFFRHWAYASWRFRPSVTTATRLDGLCEIARATIKVEITVRMPAEGYFSGMRACMRRNFETMRVALERHEMTHVAITKAHAERMVATLNRLEPQASCPAMERLFAETFASAMDRLNAEQSAYDSRTQNGVLEGVRLDPC